MSTIPTPVTQELFHYLTSHAKPEEPALRELKQEAVAAGFPEIWISYEQANFIRILLRLIHAKRVVEVGTLAGYSAIAMADALPGEGKLDTIEIDPDHAAFASERFERYGYKKRIELHQGDATTVLPKLETGGYDAAFIDADKANYGVYLKECVRLLRPGGLIMVDNAFAFGKLLNDQEATDDVWAIRAFNDLMAREEQVDSIIVPVGDGMWVGIKTE